MFRCSAGVVIEREILGFFLGCWFEEGAGGFLVFGLGAEFR